MCSQYKCYNPSDNSSTLYKKGVVLTHEGVGEQFRQCSTYACTRNSPGREPPYSYLFYQSE